MSTQQSLFETEPEAWEADDAGDRLVASVVFPTGPDQTFDYLVPDALRDQVEPGRRVRAPFGRGDRPVVGYCVALHPLANERRRLKELSAVVDARNLLTPAMLQLTGWMADYYLCTRGQALEAVLPAIVRDQQKTRQVAMFSLTPLAREKLLELKLTELHSQILQFLAAQPLPVTADQIIEQLNCTKAPLVTLRKKELVHVDQVTVSPDSVQRRPARELPLKLNPDQRTALDAILRPLNERRSETILLHGVTGSGKTEVYIQAIDEVIRFG
ncbi:MAG: DEAD/DEAH box helicase family protein, partial [Planctomycetota bacterium]|nr:DEAD/DEAH box helicase family protein [Planctomycetota bacterium]